MWWLPFSLLVRWFTDSNFSHVGVELLDGFVTDATGGSGVSVTAKTKWMKHYHVVETIELPVTELEAGLALRFATDNMNKEYGFKQILSIALRKLGIIRTNIWGNGDKKFICSEYVTRMLESIGLQLTDQPADFIGPRKLYGLLNTYLSSNVYELHPSSDTNPTR